MADERSLTGEARRLARGGEKAAAEAVVGELLGSVFGMKVARVVLRDDVYSLNSLNGFVDDGEREFFFKFHQEDGEAPGEYYNAEILASAGLPVEAPLEVSRRAGEQILLYRRVSDPRFADLCRDGDGDGDGGDDGGLRSELARAQEELDAKVGEVLCESLHSATAEEIEAEPIHRLFSGRLSGGRVERFYGGRIFEFPGIKLHWDELSRTRWVINGVEHPHTVGELFALAAAELSPAAFMADGGAAVVAHGDAHNANIFARRGGDGDLALRYFDPAFAGCHVPALLAEVKATFHNVFAHRHWLYEPELSEYMVTARREGDFLVCGHDWDLTPLRRSFLASKAERVWRPLLGEMGRRGMLGGGYERRLGLALFCCPTLVLPLRAGRMGQTPRSSLLGWMLALTVASSGYEFCTN